LFQGFASRGFIFDWLALVPRFHGIFASSPEGDCWEIFVFGFFQFGF
jgi:hypothetical protein